MSHAPPRGPLSGAIATFISLFAIVGVGKFVAASITGTRTPRWIDQLATHAVYFFNHHSVATV